MMAVYLAFAIALYIAAFLVLCIAVNRYRAGFHNVGEICFMVCGVTVGVATTILVLLT